MGDDVARLTPFLPEGQGLIGDPAVSLRNVPGFHLDATNGWLGAGHELRRGRGRTPAHGQKIVLHDLAPGAVARRGPSDAEAERRGSFLTTSRRQGRGRP